MAKFSSLLLTLLVLASTSHAEQEKLSGSQVAESVFFSTMYAKNFSDVVESSELEPKVKEEIKSYLTLHHLEKKTLATKWKESTSLIELEGESSTQTLDFSDFPSTGSVKFNGAEVNGLKTKTFSDLVAKFEVASRKKASLLNFIFAEAKADDQNDTKYSVFSAVLYRVGVDQWAACHPNRFWGEDITQSQCHSKPNSEMMLKDIGPYGSISELNCSTQGFKTASVNFRFGPVKIIATRDRSNQLTGLSYYENNELDCEFGLKNGMMTSVKNNTQAVELCKGRALGDQIGMANGHQYRKGDRPSFVAGFPIPIQRLDSCCADASCRSRIASEIKHSSSKSNNGAVKATQ